MKQVEPEVQRAWLEHPVTKVFLQQSDEMILNIRIAIGEGGCLNKSNMETTAGNYNYEVGRADGIKEMIDYATNVKQEEEK